METQIIINILLLLELKLLSKSFENDLNFSQDFQIDAAISNCLLNWTDEIAN